MSEIANGTCHSKRAPQDGGPPLVQHGSLVFQAHHVGWIVSGILTIVAVVVSFWLINKHLQSYMNKREQRYIVRILFMVPLYAVISLASFLFWNHSTPLLLLRDCYESTVLTSFFYLLLTYLSHDFEEQKEIFRKNGLSREHDRSLRRRGHKLQKWMFPLNVVKWKPKDGLHFLQLMKWGVLQYCVIRPLTTLIAVILDYKGLYCEDSWSPGWGHLYITTIVSISVSISMYCLIQLYIPVSLYLKPHKPLLKLFAIKAVVFLTFWQATGLGLLVTFGVVKDTQYMTADNINVGIEACLETFEMMIFAFLHVRAFTYKPYRMSPDKTPRFRAFLHAMNFKETLRELWAGTIYLVRRMRGRETDPQARREAALEDVFGRTRFDIKGAFKEKSKTKGENAESDNVRGLAVAIDVEEMVHVGWERQWLGTGDDYGYGLGYQARKEKSDGLEAQFERELAARGYPRRQRSANSAGGAYTPLTQPEPEQSKPKEGRRQSWWRSVYNRLSQISHDPNPDQEQGLVSTSVPRKSSSRRRSRSRKGRSLKKRLPAVPQDYDDLPPPSAIRAYRESQSRRASGTMPGIHVVEATLPEPPLPPVPPLPPLPSVDTLSPPRSSQRHSPKRKPPPRAFSVPSSDGGTPSPLLSPTTISDRPDSFLARVFPDISDISVSSVEGATTGPPSSQSHRSNIRLGGDNSVVANGMVVSQAPIVSHPPLMASHEQIVEVLRTPMESMPPLPAQDRFGNSEDRSHMHRSSHRRDSALHNTAEQSSRHANDIELPPLRPISPINPIFSPTLPKSYVPRRDQIVLPAPLAPTATSPSRFFETAFAQDSSRFSTFSMSPTSDLPTLPSRFAVGAPPTGLSIPPTQEPSSSRSKRRLSGIEAVGIPTSPPRSSTSPPSSSSNTTIRPENVHKPHKLPRSSYNVKRHSYSQDQEVQGRRNLRISAPPETSTASVPSVKSAQIQSNGERYIPHRYGRMISDGTPVSVGFLPDVVEENVQSGSGRYPPPRKVQTERRNERNERR